MSDHPPSGSRPYSGRIIRYDAAMSGDEKSIDVAVECAVNIVYGDTPYAVMMTTPVDLEDFAVGFSLTEGVVASAAEIRAIEVRAQSEGFVVAVTLTPDALQRHMARRRNMTGRTSCGLCGVEDFKQIPSATRKVAGVEISTPAIAAAVGALDARQTLFQQTRAVHAAAWCDLSGAIRAVREDVGRHNALDKLIGACLRANISPQDGFMLITSRCSFEMIEKTAIFGAPALVSVSAPTSLAIDRAQALGVTLIAVARRDGAIAFAAPQG